MNNKILWIIGIVVVIIMMLNQGKKQISISECNGILGSYSYVVSTIKPQCEAQGFICGEVTNIQGMGYLECLAGGPRILSTYSPTSISGDIQVSNVQSIINSSTLDYQVKMTLTNTNPTNSASFIVEARPDGGAKQYGWIWEPSEACDPAHPYNRHTGATIGQSDSLTITITIPTSDMINSVGYGIYYIRLISYDKCCPNSDPSCQEVSPFYDTGGGSIQNVIAEVEYANAAQTCSDGTPVGTCSSTKPKYCQDTSNFYDNCQICGCSSGNCLADGTCGTINQCTEGQITSLCLCGGSQYNDGYCCSNIWQSTACITQPTYSQFLSYTNLYLSGGSLQTFITSANGWLSPSITLKSGLTIEHQRNSGTALCTLGMIVSKGGQKYILTAGHCVTKGPDGMPDKPDDIGLWAKYTGQIIGYTYDFDDTGGIDAALISIEPNINSLSYQDYNGVTITGFTNPIINTRVYKYGISTGLTYGTITDTTLEFLDKNGNWIRGFGVTGDNGDFSTYGDSGSAIITTDTHKIVGIISAGGSSNLGLDIQNILSID